MSSVSELRVLAKTLGVRGYSVAKKADLIQLIEQHQNGAKPPALDKIPETEVKVEKVVKAKAEKPAEAPVAEAKSKRSNEWNNYLADYRKEHNVTLRQAMAEAKEAYTKHKEAKKAAAPVEEKRPFRDLP